MRVAVTQDKLDAIKKVLHEVITTTPISWDDIRLKVSASIKIKNWLQVRAAIQAMPEIKRTSSVENEVYFLEKKAMKTNTKATNTKTPVSKVLSWKDRELLANPKVASSLVQVSIMKKGNVQALVYPTLKKNLKTGDNAFTFKLFDSAKRKDVKRGTRTTLVAAQRAAERHLAKMAA